MNDLDPKALALLDSVRGTDRPTRHEKARVKRRVLARVAGVLLAASAGASSTTTAASVGTAAAGVWSAKLVVAVIAASALVAGGAATGVVVSHHHHARAGAAAVTQQVVAPRTAPLAVATSPFAPPKTEALAEPPRALPVRPAAARVERPAATPETLEEELPLLLSAQEALRLGDVDRALGLLDAHARRFPGGALAEERRAAHALAACRKAGDPLARAEAQAFLRDSSSSPLVESVRKACSLTEP
jgi:hypothetical protein